MKRLLPRAVIRNRLGDISNTTLWRMCRKGQFPKPVRISDNRVGWDEETSDAAIAALIAAAKAAESQAA